MKARGPRSGARVRNERSESELGPCPKCGMYGGELVKGTTGRFPNFVICRACGFTTEPARLKTVALKLWNEAKPPKAKRLEREERG